MGIEEDMMRFRKNFSHWERKKNAKITQRLSETDIFVIKTFLFSLVHIIQESMPWSGNDFYLIIWIQWFVQAGEQLESSRGCPHYFQVHGFQLSKHSFFHTLSSQAEAAVSNAEQLDGNWEEKKSELVQKFSGSPDVWHPTNTHAGFSNPLPFLTPFERWTKTTRAELEAMANAAGETVGLQCASWLAADGRTADPNEKGGNEWGRKKDVISNWSLPSSLTAIAPTTRKPLQSHSGGKWRFSNIARPCPAGENG